MSCVTDYGDSVRVDGTISIRVVCDHVNGHLRILISGGGIVVRSGRLVAAVAVVDVVEIGVLLPGFHGKTGHYNIVGICRQSNSISKGLDCGVFRTESDGYVIVDVLGIFAVKCNFFLDGSIDHFLYCPCPVAV